MSVDPINRAIAWLKSNQRTDGAWGEDAWDTCQVLRAFALVGTTATDSNVQAGLTYLRRNIDQNWPNHSEYYWFGPGFLGAAMEAFNRFGDMRYANEALDQAMLYYDEDEGYFQLTPDLSESHSAPAEWHTAVVITGLRSFGSVAPHREQALRAAQWLAARQAPDGSWSPGQADITTYTTMQAIVALAYAADSVSGSSARRGVDWFIHKCDGNNASLSHKLMAAAVIARTYAHDLVLTLPLSFVTELRDVLSYYALQLASLHTEVRIARSEVQLLTQRSSTLQSDNADLSSRLSALEDAAAQLERDVSQAREDEREAREHLASYALKLTPHQVTILSIIITIVSALIGTLVSIWLSQR
jgi:hypothetical protein